MTPMKYANAKDVLPEEFLSEIQRYYQGGYLYIPKESERVARRRTDYQTELEKRNQHIYLMHLEGRTNGQLGRICHLSEASIRRILLKERVSYGKMKEIIEQVLPLWGMEEGEILQVYPSAWEWNHLYIIKVYKDRDQLERNIKISRALSDCGIPVGAPVATKTGESFAVYQDKYFLMTEKLQGSNLSDVKDKTIAWEMGRAIARLHRAFVKCEREVAFWDNSLLEEMKGWIQDTFKKEGWKLLKEEDYIKAVKSLEQVYDLLQKQLIHRDVHFGNFLFSEGRLSGYIDFDLSQRNIRLFDICYFLTGLLAEETEDAFTKTEWMECVKSVIGGYESIQGLAEMEKQAVPCVMECIEILFMAYFISVDDAKCAENAYQVFRFIQDCEGEFPCFCQITMDRDP